MKKRLFSFLFIFSCFFLSLVVDARASHRERRNLLLILVLVLVIDVDDTLVALFQHHLDVAGGGGEAVVALLIEHHVLALDILGDELADLVGTAELLVCKDGRPSIGGEANVGGVVQVERVARLAQHIGLQIKDLGVEVPHNVGLRLDGRARRLVCQISHYLEVCKLVGGLRHHLLAILLFLRHHHSPNLLTSEALGGRRSDSGSGGGSGSRTLRGRHLGHISFLLALEYSNVG